MRFYHGLFLGFIIAISTLVFAIPTNAADSTSSDSTPKILSWEGRGVFGFLDDEVIVYQMRNGYELTSVFGHLTDSTIVYIVKDSVVSLESVAFLETLKGKMVSIETKTLRLNTDPPGDLLQEICIEVLPDTALLK